MSQNIEVQEHFDQSKINKMMPEKLKDVEHSQISETMKFEDLNISYWDDCDEINTAPENIPDENRADSDKISEEVQDNEISDFQRNEIEFPFPPVLYRRKPKRGEDDDACSLYVLRSESNDVSEDSYDSDDTCDNYVECGEEGMCKCRRMQGRQYYEYYLETQDKDISTMYPKGRCTLPRGAVLLFLVNADTTQMKREDIKKALLELDAKVEFVDYQKGEKKGWVRLSFSYEARIIIKKMPDKKLTIADTELVFRVLSGKEEKRYLQNVVEERFQVLKNAQSRTLSKKLEKGGFKYVTTYNKKQRHRPG